MLHKNDEEACENEVGKDCKERNGEKRTSKTISKGDEDDTGSNFSSCEHSDTKSKTLSEASGKALCA